MKEKVGQRMKKGEGRGGRYKGEGKTKKEERKIADLVDAMAGTREDRAAGGYATGWECTANNSRSLIFPQKIFPSEHHTLSISLSVSVSS